MGEPGHEIRQPLSFQQVGDLQSCLYYSLAVTNYPKAVVFFIPFFFFLTQVDIFCCYLCLL